HCCAPPELAGAAPARVTRAAAGSAAFVAARSAMLLAATIVRTPFLARLAMRIRPSARRWRYRPINRARYSQRLVARRCSRGGVWPATGRPFADAGYLHVW